MTIVENAQHMDSDNGLYLTSYPLYKKHRRYKSTYSKKHTKMRHITLDTYDWMYLLKTGKAYILNGNFNIGEHINAKCFHTSMPKHIREMIVVNKIPLISMNDINLNDINSDKKYIFELETKK